MTNLTPYWSTLFLPPAHDRGNYLTAENIALVASESTYSWATAMTTATTSSSTWEIPTDITGFLIPQIESRLFETTITTTATGTETAATWYWGGDGWVRGSPSDVWITLAPTRKQLMRDKIRQNLASSPHAYQHFPSDATEAELKALRLLKSLLMPADFKRYLKKGFIVAQGPSGIQYKIKRKHHAVRAFFCGKSLASLCIYVPDRSIPPTDEVITRLMMIRCNEKALWAGANVCYASHVNREYLAAVVATSTRFSEAQALL